MAGVVRARPCPHRCFLSEVTDEIRIHGRDTFRLMGIVVEVLHAPGSNGDDDGSSVCGTNDISYDDDGETDASAGDAHIVLDDGTGVLVNFVTPIHMLQKAPVEVGRTVECIAVLDSAKQRLVVDQMFVIHDVHAEVLRWAQIAYHRTHPQEPRTSDLRWSSSSPSHRPWHGTNKIPRAVGCGYPTDKFTVDDLYDVICSEAQDEDTEEEEDNPQKDGPNHRAHGQQLRAGSLSRQKQQQKESPHHRLPTERPRGFTSQELSSILNVEPTRMTSMIEELQMSARVYKDENGRFLPL